MATSLAGLATSIDPVTRIICAYTSELRSIPASVQDNIWYAVGSFTVPELCAARLAILGSTTGGAMLTAQIFDPERLTNATVSLNSSTETEAVSEKTFELNVGKIYMLAVKCKANVVGDAVQGLVSTIHLTD